ncbi:O-antigen ligase family protein [Lyngbya aestuarii]|uniref:O-antigen ligase family protein n=1 Tax=Lyngbya aestuarii TaxID=118322 RepID=UPI00403DD76D
MLKVKHQHPEPPLQGAWNCAQLGLLIFPLMPALGSVGLLIALLATGKQKYPTIIRSPLNRGLAILSVWLVISASFAFQPTEAFLGLANFLPFFALFAAYSVLIQTPAQLRQLAWIIVIPSLLVVILGLGQRFLSWTSPEQLQAVFGWILTEGGNPPGRIASVFMYANILAVYLQIALILGLGLLIERFQTWRQTASKSQGWVFCFLSILVIGNAIALFLTSSRNGWGIAVLSCLVLALYLGWHWLVTAVGAAALSVLWASFGPQLGRGWLRSIVPSYLWMRLSDQLYPDRPVALMRTTQWQFAGKMTLERPWLGWGLRNFTPLYEAKMQIWLGHPHNLLLMLASETGIPATLLFCGLVGWVMAQAVRIVSRSSTFVPLSEREHWSQDKLIIVVYLVAFGSCTLFNLLDVTVFDFRVNILGWILLSAIWGIVEHYRVISVELGVEKAVD